MWVLFHSPQIFGAVSLGDVVKLTTFNLAPLCLFTSVKVELFSSRMKGVKKNSDHAGSDVDVERLKLVCSLN